jgi:hypothetical protein
MPMNVEALLSASKQFLKTREGFAACPTIRGLIRHMEATLALHRAIVGSGWPGAGNVFGLYRRVLRGVSVVRGIF